MIRREVPLTVAYKVMRYCGYLLCMIFVCFCISMLSGRQSNRTNNCQIPFCDKDIYIEWGSPPNFFSLQKPSYSIPFSELEKEILFLGRTLEPNQKILLSVKQSGSRKLVASGEIVYLIYREGNLHFSEEKTPLSISVTPHSDCLVEIIMRFDSRAYVSTMPDVNNTYRFVKSKEDQYAISNNDPLIDTPMFQSLHKAKWWGLDYLFISNPKNETRPKYSGQRLEFMYDQYKEILYLGLDEHLVWEENGWRSRPLGDENRNSHYFVRIEKIYSDTLELTLWDRRRLPIHTFFLPIHTLGHELPSIEVLSKIKKRTRTVASFVLGNTRVTMRKGDLAIETPCGWKVTSSQEEKNGIFSHKVLGSLFVFDGMEMQDSTLCFVGRLFDSMRTCYQPIKIPIVQNKRKERKKQSIASEVQLPTIGSE